MQNHITYIYGLLVPTILLLFSSSVFSQEGGYGKVVFSGKIVMPPCQVKFSDNNLLEIEEEEYNSHQCVPVESIHKKNIYHYLASSEKKLVGYNITLTYK